MENVINLLQDCRVIAATRSDEEFLRALTYSIEIVFDLDPDLMNITAKVKKAHEAGKKYLLHVDLAKGLGKDESGIRFLKRIGVDGVISTKVGIIKLAREQGLLTVQRFFIVDSHSLETTAESVKSSKPAMIEIMPGPLCKVIERLKNEMDVPIISGGLIETEAEVKEILSSGAAAVSTGCCVLWGMK
jgi:glycerol uptake operon antiterminator